MQLPLSSSSVRRAAAAVAALAVVIVVVSVLTGASATAHRGQRSAPSLTLTNRSPVTIGGRGFRPHIRVRLRLAAAQTVTRHPVPNRAGAFTVTFPSVTDRCSSWSAWASQRNRATAVLRGPRPECTPAATP
jgi:hypothetical protein